MGPKCPCENIFLLEPVIFSRKEFLSPAKCGGSCICGILGKMTRDPEGQPDYPLKTLSSLCCTLPYLVSSLQILLQVPARANLSCKNQVGVDGWFQQEGSCQGLIICIQTVSQFSISSSMVLSLLSESPPGSHLGFYRLLRGRRNASFARVSFFWVNTLCTALLLV